MHAQRDAKVRNTDVLSLADQYVVTGNIIFRQRGTHWFPGDNCAMGRDHTIFAMQPGFVKYYRDPLKHPDRQYIGVVFERGQTLPQAPHAVRRRRLGMLAYQMQPVLEAGEQSSLEGSAAAVQGAGADEQQLTSAGSVVDARPLNTIREAPREVRERRVHSVKGDIGKGVATLRPGYQYRMANWEIGRAAERAKIEVKTFKPGDRFAAWRKANVRKAKNAEQRSLRRGRNKGKK